MTMRRYNLVWRGLMLFVLALFAVPCIACDDAAGELLAHEAHGVVRAFHREARGHGCAACETAHQDAPPCGCLSDASKVRNNRLAAAPVALESALPPERMAAPAPPVVLPLTWVPPARGLSPLLWRPAAADRAPPAL